MTKTWTLEEMRQEFRDRTARPSTSQITDDDIDEYLNDYWQNIFPVESQSSYFKSDFTQETSATDSGEYTIVSTILKLMKPFRLDGKVIFPPAIYADKDKFFADYPDDFEQYITSPALAIGSSSLASVANSAFKYDVSGYRYTKAATETLLSGDTIPQSKYGAFCLKVDADGTITVDEADDNITGYNSPTKAIEDLPQSDSTTAYMGFITVINTSGAFVPSTTLLNASGVTATYTNGLAEQRAKPSVVLIADNKIYLRQRANDVFLFECSEISKPDALDSDADTVFDVAWGPIIPLGAAGIYLTLFGEVEKAAEVQTVLKYRMSLIKEKVIGMAGAAGIERNW